MLIAVLAVWSTSARNDYKDYNLAAFAAQNKARTNPKYFAQLAKDQLENKFVYDRKGQPMDSICLANDFKPKSNVCYNTLSTNEGPSAWREAIDDLSNTKYNLKELIWSEGLAQEWFDHIQDIGPKGMTGHSGSDGSTPFTRIDKYTDNMGSGENLSFSDVDGEVDAVLQLLIDDGVAGRGHRKNIMKPEYTHGGVSCGCHTSYTEVCWFAYGIDVKEKDSKLVADSAPQLQTCKEYTSRTQGTTDQSYHLNKTPAQPLVSDVTIPKAQTNKQVKAKDEKKSKDESKDKNGKSKDKDKSKDKSGKSKNDSKVDYHFNKIKYVNLYYLG